MSNSFFINRLNKRLLSLTAIFLIATPAATLAQDYPIVQMLKRNASNFAIDGNNGSGNAQDVYLWGENENNVNQRWYEISRGNGYYSYQKLDTDHCLDGGRGGENTQNVYLWSCSSNNQNQHWLKVDVGDGHYRLEKRNAPGYSIDGNRGGENAQSIYLYDSNNSNKNQHWFFNVVSAANNGNNNSGTNNDNCIEVDSLNELSEYQNVSNQCVRVAPGTYSFNTGNVGDGTSFSNPKLLLFTGSNNEFIFDDVKFEYDTDIFRSFGSVEVLQFQVVGNNNTFRNLTMEDIGNTVPTRTALAISLDGADNLIEGFHVTTRGSFPYGYGDIFGKGGGSVIGHRKHGAVQFRGDRNHLKDSEFYLRSYGHGIFIQGAEDALIEGVHVEGELRTVAEVLAEEGTGSPADDADFRTVWGYDLRDLDENYRFSLQEDGIRAYSTGVIYGTDGESRSTGSVTVIDSTVKFMRSGVTIGWARGDKYVENCTVLGTETGFWVGGDATVINSRGDASVGPLLSEDVYRDSSTIELTLLDNVIQKIGDTPSFYLAGDRHNVTLKNGTSSYNSEIELLVGGTRVGHRWLAGSGEEPLYRGADNITFDNQTPYPVVLGDNSDNVDVTSCGPVRDEGRNNSISSSSNCN